MRRRDALRRATALGCLLGLACGAAAEGQFMTGKRVERDRLAAEAATPARQIVEQVGFDQNLGAPLPLELVFHDEADREVRLGDYFDGKPVVLALVYFRCPVLCTLVERGLASSLKPLELAPARDFEVVFVSIDPTDTAETAGERKRAVLASYGREETAAGWHFLRGDEAAIAALAEAVGFRYARDPATGLYAHAAGLTVATPEGRLSRYLYGVDFAPRDLKLALVESSNGTIGSPLDKALLICFRYDATLGKYTAATMAILRIGATLTILALAAFLFFALRRERRNRQLPAGGLA